MTIVSKNVLLTQKNMDNSQKHNAELSKSPILENPLPGYCFYDDEEPANRSQSSVVNEWQCLKGNIRKLTGVMEIFLILMD